MQDKDGYIKYWTKLLYKYRFVIIEDNSFEEKLSIKLSRLNVLAFTGIFVFVCFFTALFLIAYTPLKEYIPGKSTTQVQKGLIELALKSDSLEKILINRAVYLDNINKIINGEELTTPIDNNLSAIDVEAALNFETSIEDSLFRAAVEQEEKSSIFIKESNDNNILMFFPPISGMISDYYNNKEKHYGIDLVAKEKSRISAVLEGTVIISHWTAKTGYVIAVQHKNNYLSLYKHNSLLLKEVGDYVSAGEHIAIIGNSGELSSGPHLHFELWHKGRPVNPENYISF